MQHLINVMPLQVVAQFLNKRPPQKCLISRHKNNNRTYLFLILMLFNLLLMKDTLFLYHLKCSNNANNRTQDHLTSLNISINNSNSQKRKKIILRKCEYRRRFGPNILKLVAIITKMCKLGTNIDMSY